MPWNDCNHMYSVDTSKVGVLQYQANLPEAAASAQGPVWILPVYFLASLKFADNHPSKIW